MKQKRIRPDNVSAAKAQHPACLRVTLFLGMILAVCVLPSVLASCGSRTAVSKQSFRNDTIEKVLVLPFKDMTGIYGNEGSIRCPVCGRMFVAGEVIENAEQMLTDHMINFLSQNTSFKIIPPEQALGAVSVHLQKNRKILERELFAEIGRTFEADAVMAGKIYRLRKRGGNEYSVKTSASAAFDVHLINTSDSGIIWSGNFDETQVSLSENFMQISTFIKRKGKWITASELACTGLEEMLEVFVRQPETAREESPK